MCTGRAVARSGPEAERRRGAEEGPAGVVSSLDVVRRLQATAGNRAVGRLLARAPYDAKLAETASVVQPPVSWVKYPPNPLAMTRVEIFDALQLLDEWLSHNDTRFVAELKALRERVRAYAHQQTTEAEYRTFKRYVSRPPHRLGETPRTGRT
jgi:hypothetical protein